LLLLFVSHADRLALSPARVKRKTEGKMDKEFEIFVNQSATLEDIRRAGWKMYGSSGGSWWFEKRKNDKDVLRFLPIWVRELQKRSQESGCTIVRNAIRNALSLEQIKPKKGG
jgi:hypothetical protein